MSVDARRVLRDVRIRPLFAWFDMWIGVFIDRPRRRVYILPLPCLGVVIEWGIAPNSGMRS